VRRQLTSIAILALCGCGNVLVSPKSPAAGNGETDMPGFGESLPHGARSNDRIYFERAWVDHGKIRAVVAVAYASPEATGSPPFGYPVRIRGDLSVGPVIGVDGGHLDLLTLDRAEGATLMSTPFEGLAPRAVADFSIPLRGFSLNRAAGKVAWIDTAGRLLLSPLAAKISPEASSTLALPSPDDRAAFVSWAPSGFQLLARTEAGAALLYVTDATAPSVLKLESAPAREISWSGSRALFYRTGRTDGHDELRALDLSNGNETAIADLHLPPEAGDGVACPVRLGDDLYFGNFVKGLFVIERIRNQDGRKIREPFAVPPAPDEGFICPSTDPPAEPSPAPSAEPPEAP
jgi:hypothetical protein